MTTLDSDIRRCEKLLRKRQRFVDAENSLRRRLTGHHGEAVAALWEKVDSLRAAVRAIDDKLERIGDDRNECG